MRVVIVDDDRLVCLSLKTILEAHGDIKVEAMGYDGNDAIKLYNDLKPDILLMDIRMSPVSGLSAAETILNLHGEAKILFLTTFSDDEYILKALQIGAKGYIIKQNFESIIPSLRAVNVGHSVFGHDIITKIPSLISGREKFEPGNAGLTEKEVDIISLVAEGLNNKEIAARLYLSEGTVRNSISIILEKLSLRDRTQLAIFYFKGKIQRDSTPGE